MNGYASDAEVALRREAAMQLRVEGLPYSKIGEKLGISKACAYKHVQHGLEEARSNMAEDAEAVLSLELRRIDEGTKLCMQTLMDEGLDAASDDPTKGRELRLKAVDRLAKLNDQRSKLLGLYKPQEVRQSFDGEVSPADIRDALRARFGSNVAPEVADGDDAGAPDSQDS